MGDEFEMGDTRPIEERRGPVEFDSVADGDEREVSMEGGAVGRWLNASGDANGVLPDDVFP